MTAQGGLGGRRTKVFAWVFAWVFAAFPHGSGRFLGRLPRNHWFLHRILAIPPQNRALALVLGTFRTSDSSESCSRLSPGYISDIRRIRIVLSPQSWLFFGHQTHQNHAFALVLATFRTSDSSESCSRLSPGYISDIRLRGVWAAAGQNH